MKFELNNEHLEIIKQLLDIALKQGGLANKPAVDIMIQIFNNPIKEEPKEAKPKEDGKK